MYKYLWGYPGFALQDVYVSFLSCATWEPSTCLHDCRCCLKEFCAKKLTLLGEVYVSKAFTAGGQAMLREMGLWKHVFDVYIGPGGREQVSNVDWGWEPVTKERKAFPIHPFCTTWENWMYWHIIVSKSGILKIVILYKVGIYSHKRRMSRDNIPSQQACLFSLTRRQLVFLSPILGHLLKVHSLNCVKTYLHSRFTGLWRTLMLHKVILFSSPPYLLVSTISMGGIRCATTPQVWAKSWKLTWPGDKNWVVPARAAPWVCSHLLLLAVPSQSRCFPFSIFSPLMNKVSAVLPRC